MRSDFFNTVFEDNTRRIAIIVYLLHKDYNTEHETVVCLRVCCSRVFNININSSSRRV